MDNNDGGLASILIMQDNIHRMSNISQLLVHNVSLSIKQLQPSDRHIVNSLYSSLYTKLLSIMSFLTNPEFKEKLVIKQIINNILNCDILLKEVKCKRILLFRDILKNIYTKNSLNTIDWNIEYNMYAKNVFEYFQLIIEDILLSMYSLQISCELYQEHCGDMCIDICEDIHVYTDNEIILFITAETTNIINTIQEYINVCKHYVDNQELNLILDFKIITSSQSNTQHILLDSNFLNFCNEQQYFKHIIMRNTGYVDYIMDFDDLYKSIKNGKILIDIFNINLNKEN